jgi:phosphatidylglycerophosphate synthase
LVGQVVLVAALGRTVGLGLAGWLAGLGYGLVLCAVLNRGLDRSGLLSLGPADRVTLTRATLVGGVTALTVDSFVHQRPVVVLVALASVALVLDAVDGSVARHTATASGLGARFDMEVDAFLLLVLSVYAARTVDGWVLAIGAMRYAYVAAGWVLPWLRGLLLPRYWRKVVSATQGVVLVVAAADALPRPLVTAALAVSLALLIESFGRDVGWLWSHRVVRSPGRESVRSGPVRRGRHADPVVRQWRGAAAPGGGLARPRPAGPGGGRARLAASARPQ